MTQYAEVADIVHARCTGERETEEWMLDDSEYLRMVPEGDMMAWIVALVMTLCVSMRMPERFSKMNRRGPPDIWKIGVLVLYSFCDKSDANFRAQLSGMRCVLELGGLEAAPEASTLRKFRSRLPEGLLDDIIAETFRLCGGIDPTIAIDGTGFSDSNASPHYVKRITQMSKKAADGPEDVVDDGKSPPLAYSCTQVRGYEKATLAGNISTLAICICDVVSDHSADVRRILPVAERMAEYRIRPDAVIADKGYDAEYVHKGIRKMLGCEVIIPAREFEPARKGHPEQPCTGGFFRRLMKTQWESFCDSYAYRSLIECVNSMLKRVFGGEVRSRSIAMKHKEIKLACMGHNLLRMMDLRVVRCPA